ncbi:hypothetical protein SCHPADRAFT_176210 [Schizopora paradoxa]|uniref:Uncharacterized protein n=1 Tax=Schizopora paradoxa TaxID=27342 RepID=A0A0H2RYL9_9AGAM|nr:hypothetical protein SCHPADRAFT_176210 [Schizopora paradoxa]
MFRTSYLHYRSGKEVFVEIYESRMYPNQPSSYNTLRRAPSFSNSGAQGNNQYGQPQASDPYNTLRRAPSFQVGNAGVSGNIQHGQPSGLYNTVHRVPSFSNIGAPGNNQLGQYPGSYNTLRRAPSFGNAGGHGYTASMPGAPSLRPSFPSLQPLADSLPSLGSPSLPGIPLYGNPSGVPRQRAMSGTQRPYNLPSLGQPSSYLPERPRSSMSGNPPNSMGYRPHAGLGGGLSALPGGTHYGFQDPHKSYMPQMQVNSGRPTTPVSGKSSYPLGASTSASQYPPTNFRQPPAIPRPSSARPVAPARASKASGSSEGRN